MRRFPVIIGPTASGKTALAVAVARALAERDVHAEVISADSVQVYRGMDIGSAKPTEDERGGVPHRLIDVRDPRERFTVKDWLDEVDAAVREIGAAGGVPIIAGGTHLYIKAFLEGLFEGPEPDPALRDELNATALSELRAELERIDPQAAERIHPADQRRTVRAIEVFRLTCEPISAHQSQWDRERRDDCFVAAVMWETPALNQRINARVKQMMDDGFLDEVRALVERSALGEQAREALGYKQLAAHLRGERSLDDAVERTKIDTRRFAKNQRTWLRRLAATPAPEPGEKSDGFQKNDSRTQPPPPLSLNGPDLLDRDGLQTAVNQILERIGP